MSVLQRTKKHTCFIVGNGGDCSNHRMLNLKKGRIAKESQSTQTAIQRKETPVKLTLAIQGRKKLVRMAKLTKAMLTPCKVAPNDPLSR